MNSVEDAYSNLGLYVTAFIGQRLWESAGCHMKIYAHMASANQWLIYQGTKDEKGGFEESPQAIWKGLEAATYLRDDMFKTTGNRIWGLTFTLAPNGTFAIEYNYTKPDDYEETDELIEVQR